MKFHIHQRSFKIFPVVLVFLVFSGPVLLSAHGTYYEIVPCDEIRIRAMIDGGEVMSDAGVLLFPPGKTESRFILKTDDQGIFSFQPDQPGIWIAQVRGKNGHGMRINLEVDDSYHLKNQSGPRTFSILQKLIMIICVVTGLTGTALFFRKEGK